MKLPGRLELLSGLAILVLPQAVAYAAAPTIVASGLNAPGNIVVDESSVYWVDGADQIGSINKAPGGGGVTSYTAAVDPGVADLVQDNVYLYYVGDTGLDGGKSICKVPKFGGAPSTLSSTTDFEAVETAALTIGPAGGILYYESTNGNVPNDIEDIFQDIVSLPTQGGSHSALTYVAGNLPAGGADGADPGDYTGLAALQFDQLNYFPGGGPESMSSDSTNLYWSDGSNIWEMPLIGGLSTAVVTGRTNIRVIATPETGAAAGSIFWVEGNVGSASLMRREVGGHIITLVTGIIPATYRCFAVDNDKVYCERSGSLVQVSINGGAASVLANILEAGGPVSVAVDPSYVYWSTLTGQIVVPGVVRPQTATGTIMRVARPGAGPLFGAQAGTFAGQFEDGTGYVTINLGGPGAFTGTMVLDGITYRLKGSFNGIGSYTANVGEPPVTLAMQLGPANGSATAGGYFISGSAGGSAFTVYHAAYGKGQTATEAGKYTVLLEPAGEMGGTNPEMFVTEGYLSAGGTIAAFTTTGTSVNAALVAGLKAPFGVAESGGNLFVVNSQDSNGDNHSGTIGEYTLSGQTVNAALVHGLDHPTNVVVSGSYLYVANTGDIDNGANVGGSGSIGKYTLAGGTVNAGLITGLNEPADIAISGSDLFVTNVGTNNNSIFVPGSGTVGEYTTSGAPVARSLITGLSYGFGIAISGTNLFVLNAVDPSDDSDSGSIAEYTTAGALVTGTLVTGLSGPLGMGLSGTDLYVASISDGNGDLNSGSINEYTTAGAPVNPSLVTGLNAPTGVAFGEAGAAPGGIGYATLNVTTSGAVNMVGKLADGTSFSTSGVLVAGTEGNEFVIDEAVTYPSVTVKNELGSLVGAVRFVKETGTSDLNGTVDWVKPQQTKGYYAQGFETGLNVIGSRYNLPKHGSVLPGFASGTLELSDTGALSLTGSAQLDYAVTLTAANTLSVTNATNHLKVTIQSGGGTFEGSFVYPGTVGTKTTAFAGVLFQDQTIGGGFYLGPNGSGAVTLTAP